MQMKLQRTEKRCARTGNILSRCTDIEQTGLIAELYGQRTHKKWRRLYQCVSEVFAPGCGGRIGEIVLQDRYDRRTRAGRINDKEHDIPQEQSEHDTKQCRQDRLDDRFCN